ncbi:LysR substrate-binding domain-containing protein [Sphingomonas sp. 8AM]|uniref:LysR substrate-binding domain-containing protein n=1 Tax=Sphingomonas sp. 8AM TaxID=2653170 RepID=UPI0012F1CA18|nr:LysR substrate-binding domain-containing protein [Sphingomonas sp. 8AM]VXD03614.1 Transcriptional regulator, LysR family [Sphingomonas sp. 8AM]
MAELTSPVASSRRLPPLNALRAFECAARRLSFRKAADELGVTPTAISHQVRLLEDILEQPLFVRHVRRVALTQAGRALFPVLRDGFDSFASAIAQLHPQRSRSRVILSATRLFTARRLVPALGDFAADHPGIDLHLHASDGVVDLEAGDADIAVRYGNGPFPGLTSEPLMPERVGVLASPMLGIAQPSDLFRVPLLHSDWTGPMTAPDWARWARLAGISDLPVATGARLTDDSYALQAAIAGHGAVVSSLVLAAPEIRSGLLTHPFGPVIEEGLYQIVMANHAALRPEVLQVRDWLRAFRGDGVLD